ncbi:fibroblast growth factor 2-like [Montipora capricornis]|uniref:fibroblast growth factor 2-like n=1 Tax=Montipora capricornis TaxID=246305 RepID=UPI0035F13AE6
MSVTSKFCRLVCGFQSFLRVTEDRVDATRDPEDQHATIEIISFEERSIIFKGKASQKYIGVSPEGNIATYETISERCVFTEESQMQQDYGNDFRLFHSKCFPLWYLGVTAIGNACAMSISDKQAMGSALKYIEIDLDVYAPFGRYENHSFKRFEVHNTLYSRSKKGIYSRYT